ncbi:MAG: hypothetical protein A2406_02240 [Candidatus Komeilibacteria bacterium RIFOXYC1_FULL_37_11]|uniref:Uncharacterized protein n=1 Tax=Candidatus Komeilibacteria bacterium RIFOXYC1_FULL_37_11 TaxID=1798555 RepID=A0A1G2BZM8_9BACT|nr:MAG: hypothetical protein A2406_02240 [Candidatus Komeilibacteria bacterium RIFOXYC1_FULL_37_11]OGY95523.1 MAG: hypothetical protein A2611_02385 [Candidatus Komeilibacteria bacterium RIFOXYD1_FULL_37_29]
MTATINTRITPDGYFVQSWTAGCGKAHKTWFDKSVRKVLSITSICDDFYRTRAKALIDVKLY